MGAYSFFFCMSACVFVCPQKLLHWRYLLLVRVRAFIFHMSIPCDKTFLLVPSSRSSLKVKFSFQGHTLLKCKTFTLDITFEWNYTGSSYLTCEFIVTRPFCLLQVQGHCSRSNIKVKVFEKKWPWGGGGALCFTNTLFFFMLVNFILYR